MRYNKLNMKKNVIKLNKTQLRKIVAESVEKVLKEDADFKSTFGDGMRTDTYGDGNLSDTYPFDEDKIKEQIINFRDAIYSAIDGLNKVREMDVRAMRTGLKREKDLDTVFQLLHDCCFGEFPSKLQEAFTLLNRLAWKFTPNIHNGYKKYSEQF